MNAWEPVAAARRLDESGADESEGDEGLAPFVVNRPAPGTPASPLVFASPHSGRRYPDDFVAASRLDPRILVPITTG